MRARPIQKRAVEGASGTARYLPVRLRRLPDRTGRVADQLRFQQGIGRAPGGVAYCPATDAPPPGGLAQHQHGNGGVSGGSRLYREGAAQIGNVRARARQRREQKTYGAVPLAVQGGDVAFCAAVAGMHITGPDVSTSPTPALAPGGGCGCRNAPESPG